MRTGSDRLIFGKPSLSSLPCTRCREDTIHRRGVCIHCGTLTTDKAWGPCDMQWSSIKPQLSQRYDQRHANIFA